MKLNVFYTLFNEGTRGSMEIPHERNPMEAASLGKLWVHLAEEARTVENGPLGLSVTAIRLEIIHECGTSSEGT